MTLATIFNQPQPIEGVLPVTYFQNNETGELYAVGRCTVQLPGFAYMKSWVFMKVDRFGTPVAPFEAFPCPIQGETRSQTEMGMSCVFTKLDKLPK